MIKRNAELTAKRLKVYTSIHLYSLLAGLVFALVFPPLVAPLLLLSGMSLILSGSNFNVVHWTFKALFLAFGLFYLLHLVSGIYSSNIDQWLMELEIKSGLVLIPLLIGLSKPLRSVKVPDVMKVYTLVVSLLALVYLVTIKFGLLNLDPRTDFIHRAYLSLHFSVVVVYNVHQLFVHKHALRDQLFCLFSSFICAGSIIISQSRIGIIVLACSALLFLIWFVLSKRYLLATLGVLILIAGSITASKLAPESVARMKSGFENYRNPDKYVHSVESVTVRVFVWDACWEIIRENPIKGVGAGDVRDSQIEKYKELNYGGASSRGLDAHNQFLESGVAFGYIGIASVLIIFMTLLVIGLYYRSLPLIFLSLALILASLTESILERQTGVFFVTLLGTLLILEAIKGDYSITKT